MTVEEFAAKLESRLYIADANYETIRCLCYDARERGFASVQVWPNMIHLCTPILKNSGVSVAALNSWSYTGFTAEQMAFEAADSVKLGADIVEAMINVSWLKSGMLNEVENDVIRVCDAMPGNAILKFVVQTEYLNDEELKSVCEILAQHKVDYIITSTGYYSWFDDDGEAHPFVTTVEEIKKIKEFTDGKVRIQAQGNILDVNTAMSLIDAGADIIGTREAVAMYDNFKAREFGGAKNV